MMTFSQISFTNYTANPTPSWMKMDNFVDYVYPHEKLSLYNRLRNFFTSLA